MWPAFRSGANSNITFEYSKAYGGSYTPKAGDIIFISGLMENVEAVMENGIK